MNLMIIARGVERIGDHAEKIAKNVILANERNLKFDKVEELRKLSTAGLSILDKAIESHLLKNIKTANAAIDAGNDVVARCEKLSSEVRSKHTEAAVIYSSIVDSIIRVTMYGMDIAEIAINGAMRMEEK
jgi:Na+/phosphate symporter